MPLFTLRNVRKTRTQGPGYTLCIEDFTIHKGEKIAITGPSGCGKSTALDLLGMALEVDTADTFLFAPGQEASDPVSPVVDVAACWRQGQQDKLARLRLRHMGYVLQTGGLLPYLTVRENMAVTLSVLEKHESAVRERVDELARRLGIERLLEVMPGTLSIGERQRVAIGRALAARPAVILADEPTAALDPLHAERVLRIFLQTVEEDGATLILVTHDARIVSLAGLDERPMRLEAHDDGVYAVL